MTLRSTYFPSTLHSFLLEHILNNPPMKDTTGNTSPPDMRQKRLCEDGKTPQRRKSARLQARQDIKIIATSKSALTTNPVPQESCHLQWPADVPSPDHLPSPYRTLFSQGPNSSLKMHPNTHARLGSKGFVAVETHIHSPLPNEEWHNILEHALVKENAGRFDVMELNANAFLDVSPIDLGRLAASIRRNSPVDDTRKYRTQLVEYRLGVPESRKRHHTITAGKEHLTDDVILALLLFSQGNQRVYGRYVGADAVVQVPSLHKIHHKHSFLPWEEIKHRNLFTMESAAAMIASAVVAEKSGDFKRDAMWVAAEQAMVLALEHATNSGIEKLQIGGVTGYLQDSVRASLFGMFQATVTDMSRLNREKPDCEELAYEALGEVVAITHSALMRYGTTTDANAEHEAKMIAGTLQVLASLAFAAPGAIIAPMTLGAGSPVLALAAVTFSSPVKQAIRAAVDQGYEMFRGRKPGDLRYLATKTRMEMLGELQRSRLPGVEAMLKGYGKAWKILSSPGYGPEGEKYRKKDLLESLNKALTAAD
jgi:hypothetical protein